MVTMSTQQMQSIQQLWWAKSLCLCPCQHAVPWEDPYPGPQSGPDAVLHYAAEVHAHRSHACNSVVAGLAAVSALGPHTLLSVCVHAEVARTAALDHRAAAHRCLLNCGLWPHLTQIDLFLHSKVILVTNYTWPASLKRVSTVMRCW